MSLTHKIAYRLDEAFEALFVDANIRTEHLHTCCQSCGIAEMLEDPDDWNGYAFYHQQDADALTQDGNLRAGEILYLSHGALNGADPRGVANTIVGVLRGHGLEVEWSGDLGRRIAILGAKEDK